MIIELLRYKFNKVFKLKRTYILIGLSFLAIFGCFLLNILLSNYTHMYTILTILTVSGIYGYLFSIFLVEELESTLMLFLKTNKTKVRFYYLIVSLMSYLITFILLVALFLLLGVFKQISDLILMVFLTSFLTPIISPIVKRYVKGV